MASTQPDLREQLREIIFEADTKAGSAFDVCLLIAIVASVAAVMIESIPTLRPDYVAAFLRIEWFFTALFTIEFALRLYTSPQPLRYAFSFFGLVDFLSILPSYLSLIFPGAHSLMVIRSLRLLRIFRILKLGRFLGEANVLLTALRTSTRKVLVFLGTVLLLVIIIGTAMHLIEGDENGFNSIPRSMYWAIVTMTTVGYGDLVPKTPLGQMLASFVMVLGYSILAIPTGIFTAEILQSHLKPITTRVCHSCMVEGHDYDARYCKSCGELLTGEDSDLQSV